MGHRLVRQLGIASFAAVLLLVFANTGLAVHESTNSLTFEPAIDQDATPASGAGVVDFRGGDSAESRWTAMFRFERLDPGAVYVVAVQGRYGEEGSAEASEFTPICSFTTDSAGNGGCWYYFVVLINLGVVQLHAEGLDGAVVLQATREDGPGSIVSQPNRFSPAEPATPAASPDATSAVAMGFSRCMHSCARASENLGSV